MLDVFMCFVDMYLFNEIIFKLIFQRQIDILVEEIDVTHSGSIKWE